MLIIYKVTNLENGKIYIGQTSSSLDERRRKHEYDAQRLNRKTVKFHNALLKYGFDKFNWEILRECETQEELDYYEEYYIMQYNSIDRELGYNLKHGGKFGGCYSDEAKEHMSDASLKKWQNEETASKMREGLKKATETWIQECKDRRIKHTCPVCGNTFYTANYNNHTYCSLDCANLALKDIAKDNLQKAMEVNKARYEEQKNKKITLIYEWVKNNKTLLKNISWNNLSFIENSLCVFLGVKDHRTVAKLLDTKNKKELVKKLIDISENIC
jgi:group I intron endonuclease